MDGHTFISLNVPNIVTIWIVIALGVVALKLGASFWQGKSA